MVHRILLLDVGTPREEVSEPIGIETIAPYVEEKNKDIELVLRSIELDDTKSIEAIFHGKPFSVIGISTKIRAFDRIEKLIKISQQLNHEAILVIGDIVSTFAYHKILEIYPNIICVRGEGEEAFSELVNLFIKYGNHFTKYLVDVPNLAYFHQGRIIKTNRSAINVKNAKHPKRFSLDQISKQYGIAHLEASRGCIYSNCSFCGINEKYGETAWRPFNINYIIKELEILSNAGFKSPYFTDEDFFGNNVNRAIEIANEIIKAKKKELINPDMDFYFNARAGSVLGENIGGIEKSKEILALLKRAGLREIFIGFESGEKKQINRYKKMTTVQKNMAAIKVLDSVGVDLDAGFIFFDPNSTIENIRDNLDFILNTGLNTNYSRLLKKLRLQPFTKITDDFLLENPSSNINLNLVCYDYNFADSRVAEIFNNFSQWEAEDLDIIYNMQSFCRGEVESESERQEVKNIISTYRFLDIEYLNAITAVYENNYTSRSYLESIESQFKRIREHLDKSFLNKIRWFDSSYRRFNRSKDGHLN